ncbi:LysR substrate-binding domain-containing protein [Streptomyces albus]
MTEWDLKKLRVLRTLADVGTVTAAAEALFMTPSAVSQQLTGSADSSGSPCWKPTAAGCGSPPPPNWSCTTPKASSPNWSGPMRHWPATYAARRDRCGWARSAPRSPRSSCPPSPRSAPPTRTCASAYARRRPPRSTTCSPTAPWIWRCPWPPTPRPPGTPALPTSPCTPTRSTSPCRPGTGSPPHAACGWPIWPTNPGSTGTAGPGRRSHTTVCEAAGFVPRQAHAAADWAAILALVGAGLGVALVPRMAGAGTGAADAARVTVRVLGSDRPRRYVVAATRRGAEEWPGVQRVLDALRNVQLD